MADFNGGNSWRKPKKAWRYPGVPIPERLKSTYEVKP